MKRALVLALVACGDNTPGPSIEPASGTRL